MAVEHRLITTEIFTPDQRDEIENSSLPRGPYPDSHERGIAAAEIYLRGLYETGQLDIRELPKALKRLSVHSRVTNKGIVDALTLVDISIRLHPAFLNPTHLDQYEYDPELTGHLRAVCSREFPGTVPVPSLPIMRGMTENIR